VKLLKKYNIMKIYDEMVTRLLAPVYSVLTRRASTAGDFGWATASVVDDTDIDGSE
jgi:hypothetical protein